MAADYSPGKDAVAISGVHQLSPPGAHAAVAVSQVGLAALQELVRQLKVEVVVVALQSAHGECAQIDCHLHANSMPAIWSLQVGLLAHIAESSETRREAASACRSLQLFNASPQPDQLIDTH